MATENRSMRVVREGEALQEWLRRSMAVLIEQGVDEAQSKRIATDAWNRVNGDGKMASSKPKPAPASDTQQASQDAESDGWGEASANAAMDGWGEGPDQEAAQNADWNNKDSWGTLLRNEIATDPQQDAWGEETDPEDAWGEGEGDGEEMGEDEGESEGPQTPAYWLVEQIEGYANALLDQMVAAGHFEQGEVEGVQSCINSAMDRMEEAFEAMAKPPGEPFTFAVAVPPPGYFKQKTQPTAQRPAPQPPATATKSMDATSAPDMPAPADDPKTTPLQNAITTGSFTYSAVDESSPTGGYVVPDEQKSLVVPANVLAPDQVEQFITANADAWSDPQNQLCAIVDESGAAQLSVCAVSEDPQQAADLCQQGCGVYLDLVQGAVVQPLAEPPADEPPMAASQPAPMDEAAYATKFFDSKGFAGPSILTLPQKLHLLSDDLAIKSIGRGRVGNYLCVWGDQEQRDLGNEYFTPDTQELTAVFEAMGGVPAIYHHAMDGTLKSAVVGIVDRMERDDTGLWIEAQIREHDLYKRMIMPLIEKKKLGWSSGTLPGARQVNKATGEIVRWPIVEASMTPTPAEWRMAVQWPVQSIKSAYEAAGLSSASLESRIATAS